MLTRQTIVGFLGADAEIRQVGDRTVMNFNVACSRGRDRDPLWIEVAFWNPPEGLQKYLQKGKLVVIEGVPTTPNGYIPRADFDQLIKKTWNSYDELYAAMNKAVVARNKFTAIRVITESKTFVADEKPASVVPGNRPAGGISLNIGNQTANAGQGDDLATRLAQVINATLYGGAESDPPF